MSEIINSQQNNSYIPNQNGIVSDAQNPDLNIQAHYSNNMKVKRAKSVVNDIPPNLPIHHTVSPHEMDLRMKNINTDIYEGTKKEMSNHDFNSKLYFKICGGVALSAAIIAIIRKLGK